MERIHSNWNHDGISGDVHFTGHLRSNRTNVVCDKRNIRNMQSGGGLGNAGSRECIILKVCG